LWSWQRAQPIVSPSKLVPEVALGLVLGNLRAMHAGREEAGRRHSQRIVRLIFIARELPLHKCVERQIVVHGADHEVAVVICRRPVGIVLEAVALGESRQVEPPPPPTLAEPRTGQQAIDEFFVGIR
jgi:hypothetical protein